MSSAGTSKPHNSTKCRPCWWPEQGAEGLQAALRAVTAGPSRPPPSPRGRRSPGLPARAGLSLAAPGRCDSRQPPPFPSPPASALTFSHQQDPHVLLHGRARCPRPGAAHIGRGGRRRRCGLACPGSPHGAGRARYGGSRGTGRDWRLRGGCAGRRPPLRARAGGSGCPGLAVTAASAEGQPGALGQHRGSQNH